MSDGAPHILYIDDEDGVRRLVAKALGRRGFTVTTAGSGPEGLELARAQRFDLVAVDHYMPSMDGLETLAALQAIPDPAPVVYVTGSEETRIAVAALKAGAADYVTKTIGEDFFDLLATAFRQALEKVELRRAKEGAEAALRSSHTRLEALLKEVNHRVANSLQMVSTFVQMQANALTDETSRLALTETQRRIAAISRVHRELYSSDDVETVEMEDYLSALVRELETTWSSPTAPCDLVLSADRMRLKTDRAVSVGVIVTELVSNACKYAYGEHGGGQVRILFRREADAQFLLRVEDDGEGFVDGHQPQGTGLGTKLIRAMASSLHTEVAYEAGPSGFSATLRAAT